VDSAEEGGNEEEDDGNDKKEKAQRITPTRTMMTMMINKMTSRLMDLLVGGDVGDDAEDCS
jgi:hypothetical protein